MTLTCHCTIKQDCTDVSVVCSAVFTKMQCTGTGAASPALGGSSRVNCRRSLVPTAQLLTLTCSPLVSPSKPYQLVKYRSWTVILHLLVLIMEIMQNPSVRNLSANVVTIFPPQTAQCATWVWLDFPTGIIDSVIFCNFQLLRP